MSRRGTVVLPVPSPPPYSRRSTRRAKCLPAYDALRANLASIEGDNLFSGSWETPMSYETGARTASTARPGPGPLGLLGRACYRHRWITLIVWLAGVACLVTLWTRFGAPAQDIQGGGDPGQSLLNRHFPHSSGDSLTLAIRSTAPIRSPATRARIEAALIPFERAAHVTSVTDPYRVPGQISRDGHIAFATVQFGVPSTGIGNGEAVALMQDARAASGHGVTFSRGGDVVDLAETPYGGPSDAIGAVAAAVVLLIAFGSFLAMGLPIVTALLGIGGGLSVIALLGHVVPAPSFSPIIAAMIGLGLGIMLAPRAGQETRDQLKEKAQAVTERLKSTAADVGGRVRESAGDVASKVREKMDKDDILNRLGRDG